MKNLVVLAVLLFASCSLIAQHETLFNRARVVGGFGGTLTEVGLGNDLNTSVGGGGGIVINDFFIGAYGLGSVDFDELFDTGDIERLEIGHGGFWLGFNFPSHKLVHLHASTRIGWGAVNVSFLDNNFRYTDLDRIFALTPEAGIELNVTRWFRVNGTVGYRWISGTNEAFGYKDEDFSGAVATIGLRFGWFGWRR